MNLSVNRKILGGILLIEAAFLAIPSMIAFFLKESSLQAFLITIAYALIIGILLYYKTPKSNKIKAKDGLFVVTVGWIMVSIVGAIPFYLSGSVNSIIDAIFESVSGFTTTGGTVIENIDILPKSIIFWRNFTNWLGGMGILIFTLALLPALGLGSFQIFKAESPGPNPEKMSPKINDTAKILYITYFAMTVIQTILLMFGGMTFFDALLYSFSTIGTSGFSTSNGGIAAYNSIYIEFILATFMIISGINFYLHYCILTGKFKNLTKNKELKTYFKLIIGAMVIVILELVFRNGENFFNALRFAYFHVASIITTTGYATVDYNLWPTLSKMVLLLLMIIGGSAGSTAGGIKVSRFQAMIQIINREITLTFHPRAIVPITKEDKSMDEREEWGVAGFIFLYILTIIVGVLLISIDNQPIDMTITSVIAALGNIGPGFGNLGPMSTFLHCSTWSKIVYCGLMLLGRLELITIIAILAPNSLRREI